jgi:hypothetical protein
LATTVSFGQATRHVTTAASEAYAAAPLFSDSPARFRVVVISVVVSKVISAGSFSTCVRCSFSRFLSDLVSPCGAFLLPPAGGLHLKSWLCEISFSRWMFPFFAGFRSPLLCEGFGLILFGSLNRRNCSFSFSWSSVSRRSKLQCLAARVVLLFTVPRCHFSCVCCCRLNPGCAIEPPDRKSREFVI